MDWARHPSLRNPTEEAGLQLRIIEDVLRAVLDQICV
jgi:hypothetical protein